jgi:hypothetical protein
MCTHSQTSEMNGQLVAPTIFLAVGYAFSRRLSETERHSVLSTDPHSQQTK